MEKCAKKPKKDNAFHSNFHSLERRIAIVYHMTYEAGCMNTMALELAFLMLFTMSSLACACVYGRLCLREYAERASYEIDENHNPSNISALKLCESGVMMPLLRQHRLWWCQFLASSPVTTHFMQLEYHREALKYGNIAWIIASYAYAPTAYRIPHTPNNGILEYISYRIVYRSTVHTQIHAHLHCVCEFHCMNHCCLYTICSFVRVDTGSGSTDS